MTAAFLFDFHAPPFDEAAEKENLFYLVVNSPAHWQMLHRDDPLFSLEFDRMKRNPHGFFDWLWNIPLHDLQRCDGYVWPDGRVTACGHPPMLYNPNRKTTCAPLEPFPACPYCEDGIIDFDSLGVWSDRMNTWMNYSRGDACPYCSKSVTLTGGENEPV